VLLDVKGGCEADDAGSLEIQGQLAFSFFPRVEEEYPITIMVSGSDMAGRAGQQSLLVVLLVGESGIGENNNLGKR
jgi:hypothetical protein